MVRRVRRFVDTFQILYRYLAYDLRVLAVFPSERAKIFALVPALAGGGGFYSARPAASRLVAQQQRSAGRLRHEHNGERLAVRDRLRGPLRSRSRALSSRYGGRYCLGLAAIESQRHS